MSALKVLGLSGGAGVGKDTLASLYVQPQGYLSTALADEIKIRLVAAGLCTWEEAFVTKPPHIRKLMQEEGTERGRNIYGEDYWVNILFEKLRTSAFRWGANFTQYVVTDVRFPNEVEAIQRRGGKVIRIEAPERYSKNGLSAEALAHPSERALDDYPDFDAWVFNDPVDEPTVGGVMLETLRQLGMANPVWTGGTSPTAGVLGGR